MARKVRIEVPHRIAHDVDVLSARACCICKAQKDCQIHHLDQNPANNEMDNLVLLCLEHHSEAGKRGGLGRILTPAYIKHCRDEWYRIVETRNNVMLRPDSRPSARVTSKIQNVLLGCLAKHEVIKLHHLIRAAHKDWPKLAHLLEDLHWWGDHHDVTVRREVAETLYSAASLGRMGMTREVSSLIHSVAIQTLPSPNFRAPNPLSKETEELVEQIGNVAFNVIYDAALYLKNIKIVDDGGRILWWIRRFATINKNTSLESATNEHYDRAMEAAKRGGNTDAVRWLAYLKEDAVTDPHKKFVPYPEGLEAKVFGR